MATTGGRIRFDHLGTGQFTDYLISSSITIPSNISVAFDVNTRLKVPKGVTVTLPEPPIAQRHQIFNCTGTGRVIFTKPSTVLPHWWGAVDDATVNLASPTVNGTDCTDALQRAGNTVNSSGGGVIDVSTSDKAFALHGSTGLNYNNFQNVTLRGSRGSLNDAIDGVNLFFTSIPTHCISLDSAQHCTFDGVGIAFMSQSLSGDLLHFGVSSGVASDCTINNCSFSGRTASSVTDPAPAGRAAIYLEEIDNFKITNNLFSNVNRAIETTVSANVVDVSGNAFVSCGNYPIYLTDITESWNIQGNAFKRGHKSDDLAWQGLTLAVQALGTPTSLNFQANWLGDGSGTTDPVPNNTTKNPMLFIQNGAGVTIFNNRFLNETDTDNYAINIDNCVGVNLTTNKFEGTPSLQTTSEFSGYNLKLLLANNEFGDTPDLTWALDYNRIDATNTIGATIIRSIGGDDYVGENAADLGLGSTDGTDPYVGQSGRLGGGIRMGASGEMYFTVREDTTTPFEFWNINKLVSFDSTKASFFIPFGYATGVGGAVTQLTSKSTGATLSKICGVITMNNAALAADTEVQFTLTNTTIAVDDTIQINHKSGGTYGAYQIQGRCGAGSAIISVRNVTGGSLSEAIVLQYSVIKGVVA